MRPGNVVHTIVHDLTAAADIVEITVNFNQANIGYLAVDIVTKHAVIVLHDAILVRSTRNELALCVKGIGSFLHQTVHSGAVVGLVHDQLALAVGIVVIVTDLDHTCRSLDAVDIVDEIFASLQDSVLAGVLVVQNDTVLIEVVAPFRKRKAIGLVEPAILAVQHSALHRRREGQALTLLQILLNREVIIVDLAVLLDHALQTGLLLDDAAVEPIGIISDGVNTGNVALEYAFRIKDAAGFFRCSIGDQRRDSGSRVSGFGVQIIGFVVNDGPTGLLQFAVLVVLLAVHIRKPAVPDLPLCIQRHISGQFKNCALIGIGGSAAIGGGVPADELVALTSKGVGIQGSVHTDFKALRLHTAFAAVGIEGDGVEHTGSFRVLCRISSILFSSHNLRAPAGEGVAVVLVRSLICAALEGRHGALQIIFLSYDLTINYPSDMCAGLRNFRALFQQFIADRAVGVASVTGCRKRCFDRIANLRLVASSRDHFNSGDRCAANRAFDARRMTGLGAGSGLFRNFNRSMSSRVDCFSLGCIANCAGVGLDTDVLTGGSGRDLALIPAVVLGGNSRAGAYFLAAILAVGVAGVAGLGAGCFLGITKFCVLMCARRAAPNAIDIVNDITSVCGRGFGIRAVAVVQLGGGDGDSHRLIAICIILIGFGLRAGCALLNVLAGAVAGADIRTALGGVDGANRRYAAVHIHLRINQVVIGAVVCLTRRIGHRLKLAGAPDKVVGVPLIAVIEIDILPVCNRQASALGNIDLNARQQSCILIDGRIAGLNIDGNVVGDRQHIACRVNIHACKRQRQRVQCRLAVYCEYKTVCLFIVILSKATGFHFEHTGVANEINSSSICGFHCKNAAENNFVGACVQRQGNLNILNEILGEGENLVAHIGRCATATEVCNLIEFVHRSARFSQNRAAAGDKAPRIELAAILHRDRAVIRHFNIAIIAHRTTLLTAASCKISAAQTDGTIDGNRSAFAHRQRSERLRLGSRPNRRRSIRIQRSRLIKRNQQGNTRRDGISTADRTVCSQCDFGLTVCLRISNRFIQVCKPLAAGFKQGRRFTCEPRCDSAVIFNVQRSLCRRADIFLVRNIIPAHELITRRRGRHYLISSHRTLSIAILLGNEFSVYCISTVFSRHESRSCIDIAYQNHVGKGDLRSSTGAARLDVYFNGLVCRQFLGKTGTRRNLCTIHLNFSAVLLNRVVKGKGCCCRLLICNCQCGFIGCIAACSTRAGSCADNARTIGRPSIICITFKTQPDIFVG